MDPNSLLASSAGSQWQRIGIRHHHGINIPLFSLHSQTSCGIGEFTDLIPLLEWCKSIGFDIIQLLPLNDTGDNSSPYSAISAFALNPIHLGLAQLPDLDAELLGDLRQMQNRASGLRVDYPAVRKTKDAFLRKYYQKVFSTVSGTEAYKQFVQNNDWLYPYALFKVLKIMNHWSSWTTWSADLQKPVPEQYQQLLKEHSLEISYHIFVQFLCFQQFAQVKCEAERQGVFLKGDIPILIDRESADVWHDRILFLLQFSAGAPPDMYAAEGQNWGSPIYNWSVIEEDGYRWWKERLQVASALYHLYRIDHIVGFFRIWAIPEGHPGHEGGFIPEDSRLWIPQGTKVMHEMLTCCPLLPIGEDLGSVPLDVKGALSSLGISGTRVMRWERMWDQGRWFIPFADYALASMTTVSTHDSDTLLLWWKHSPDEARDFAQFKGWEYTADLSREHNCEILYDSHHTGSLFHINLLQEYLALVPGMTWDNPEDERVNRPGTVSDSNWSYRFRPSLEQIVASDALRSVMHCVKG